MRRSGLFFLTLVAAVSFMAVDSQAQSLLTRHVREVTRNGAGEARRAASRRPDHDAGRCSAAARSGRAESISERTLRSGQPLLPALPHCAGVHRAVWSQPGKTMTPWFVSRKRTASPWLAAHAMAWTCRSKGPVSAVESCFPCNHGYLPAPHREPHLLRAGPRAHDGSAVPALAHLRPGQLLDPASHVRQEERLREGPRHRCRSGRVACHHRLRPFGFVPGQRHARGLLRRNGAHRRRPEPRIARVSTAPTWPT